VVLAVISDTHLPRGARRLPDACVERLEHADLILHAGDFVAYDVLIELEAYGEVAAVHGNVDSDDLRRRLPPTLELEVGGATIAVVHNGGPRQGRMARLRTRFPNADGVVFGHSHEPLLEREGGFQIFNPGSPTDRRRQPRHTMGMARADAGRVEFELVVLD
jgi:putative phosphoesterase